VNPPAADLEGIGVVGLRRGGGDQRERGNEVTLMHAGLLNDWQSKQSRRKSKRWAYCFTLGFRVKHVPT
jgi:hypothetical protein